ncbi:MAG: hypothetical protein FJX67_14695 [Alphaproteobacteria bacterium]|nr:hypothetical protein [Alphaproteobacteria bacterium]
MVARGARAEVTIALGLAAVFAVVVGTALGYPRDARLFPVIIGTGGLVLSLALAILALMGRNVAAAGTTPDMASEEAGAGPARFALAVLAAPVFGLLLWLVGFWIATAVAVYAIPWLMGYRHRLKLLLLALGTIAAHVVTFPLLLKVPLPVGELGEWFLHAFVYAR